MDRPRSRSPITTVLDRWGNSLGVRLPKRVSEAAGLQEGDRVCIEVESDGVFIRRAKPTYRIEELLDGLTPEMLHGEIDTGGPAGLEDVW